MTAVNVNKLVVKLTAPDIDRRMAKIMARWHAVEAEQKAQAEIEGLTFE
jgi:hypothetical protein